MTSKNVSAFFDRCARPRLQLFGRSWSSFHVCGVSGLTVAVALGAGLVTWRADLSLSVLAAVVVASCATFLVLTFATKVVVGVEKLIYYHHEIAILLVAGLLLRLLGQPVVPYLDVTVLGVGMFLAWGRIGCLMVGCCHGRPHRWGVCYGSEHVAEGFAPHLAGVRLFPIQLVESALVLVTVGWGTLLVWQGGQPGEALIFYVMGYGAARFALEFARGDADRPYLAGFSEAQWTSLAIMGVALAAGLRGDLPLRAWHWGAVVIVGVMAVTAYLKRRLAGVPKHTIFHPHHIDEVARVLHASSLFRDDVEQVESVLVGTTTHGYRISAGVVEGESGSLRHYTLSRRGAPLSRSAAGSLQDLILRLKHPNGSAELLPGPRGVFHVLVRPPGQRRA